jgi:DNA-binding transcriptional MerR regulator
MKQRGTRSSLPAPALVHSGLPEERKYFKIGEVASLLQVEPHVLRYWETQFPQVRPVKARSGHRLYRRRDVDHLIVIHNLLHVQRYTIAGARESLRKQGVKSLLPQSLPPAQANDTTPPMEVRTHVDSDVYDDERSAEPSEERGFVLHLASKANTAETELSIEALDGDELDEALERQLTEQQARGRSVARVDVGSDVDRPALADLVHVRAELEEARAALTQALVHLTR